ncbi:uncharacterized protein LOC128391627 isoform X2 [Panonychus citri]|nr:uncharacterized protein LOC128391627 isoform X2 [Panonychus citri]
MKNQYYLGDCSMYPFYVDPDPHSIISRETSIIATLVDTENVIYFFESKKVIIIDGGRSKERSIDQVFEKFEGPIVHAVTIPKPGIIQNQAVPYLVTLYTKKRIFYYGEKKRFQGIPFWTEIDPWNADPIFATLNRTLPPITRILGVDHANMAKTLVVDSEEKEIFFQADISVCGDIIYRFNLIDCLEENKSLPPVPIRGQLVRCTSKNFPGPNLLTLMLWGSFFLIVLAILGLIKCGCVWMVKKCRRTRHKVVRFKEDNHKGNSIIFSYGIEHASRIQTFGFDSVGQSAVSINDDYKDINYSSDVAEDEIENDSKLPLESIQSSNVI